MCEGLDWVQSLLSTSVVFKPRLLLVRSELSIGPKPPRSASGLSCANLRAWNSNCGGGSRDGGPARGRPRVDALPGGRLAASLFWPGDRARGVPLPFALAAFSGRGDSSSERLATWTCSWKSRSTSGASRCLLAAHASKIEASWKSWMHSKGEARTASRSGA